MNLYEHFLKQENTIKTLKGQILLEEAALTEIKRQLYKRHNRRLKEKPIGKSIIKEDGFSMIYTCTQKITLLTESIKKDGFKSSAIIIKKAPASESLVLDKKEYKSLSDKEQEKLKQYLIIENNKPTIKVEADE